MRRPWANFEKQLKRRIPPRAVLLLPGEFFFSQVATIPEGMSSGEVDQFAEFFLESLAPFPLEQLVWGFVHDQESGRILLFAAHLQRLRASGLKDLNSFYHVFPSFITARNRNQSGPSISFVQHLDSLSIVSFDSKNPVPSRVTSFSFEEGEANAETEESSPDCQALLDHEGMLDSKKDADEGIWRVEECCVEHDDSIKIVNRFVPFRQVQEAIEESRDLGLDHEGIWKADVRNKPFLHKLRKERSLSRTLWRTTIAAGIAAAILLLFQIGFWATAFWIGRMEKTVTANAEEVLAIDGRDRFARTIEQRTQKEFRPFSMLEAMNVDRPKTVHFTEADSDSLNQSQMIVRGLGSNVEAVNRYSRQLEQSPRIAEVINHVTSKRGKAPFTLTVTFDTSILTPGEVVAEAKISDPDESQSN